MIVLQPESAETYIMELLDVAFLSRYSRHVDAAVALGADPSWFDRSRALVPRRNYRRVAFPLGTLLCDAAAALTDQVGRRMMRGLCWVALALANILGGPVGLALCVAAICYGGLGVVAY